LAFRGDDPGPGAVGCELRPLTVRVRRPKLRFPTLSARSRPLVHTRRQSWSAMHSQPLASNGPSLSRCCGNCVTETSTSRSFDFVANAADGSTTVVRIQVRSGIV